MKNLLFPAMLLAATCLAPLPVSAQDSPMVEQMDALDDAYKAFRREKDPEKGAAAAREAQDIVLKVIPMTPALVEDMPDGEAKTKALIAYRKQMGQLFVTFCEVEAAFADGEIEKVAELVDTLKSQKKEGHDAFIEE